jgi:FlaA1/EpsC-like NDP-sugar epimerase
MKHTTRLVAGESPPARAETDSAEFTESYSLRHRHRPWVAHQKLVAVSFLGDAAIVLISLMVAYLIRFETGVREVGVVDSVINLKSYCGHVLLGGTLLIFLLANFRLHDPRNFLAIRTTFAIIAKTCVIWGVSFLALALVLKIDPLISRMYCAIGCVCSMVGLLSWRWVLYCVLRRDSFANALRQKAVFLGWNEECDRAVKRFSDGRSHQISVTGVISPPGGGFEKNPPAEYPVLGSYEGLRPILRSSGADLVMVR